MKMKEELSPETTADAKEASSPVETIVIGRTLMDDMDFLSIKQTGNSKYGTIKIEIMHPDGNDPAEHELELSVSNSEMDKDGDYMPITLQKDQVRKLIDFLTSCEKVL